MEVVIALLSPGSDPRKMGEEAVCVHIALVAVIEDLDHIFSVFRTKYKALQSSAKIMVSLAKKFCRGEVRCSPFSFFAEVAGNFRNAEAMGLVVGEPGNAD